MKSEFKRQAMVLAALFGVGTWYVLTREAEPSRDGTQQAGSEVRGISETGQVSEERVTGNKRSERKADSQSDRKRAAGRSAKMAAMEEAAKIGRDHMIALWVKSTSDAFAKTSRNLMTDLSLSTAQAAKVEALFARQLDELASMLASLTSDEAEDPHETLRQITALLRNKGLRDGLVKILSSGQLAAYDAAQAKRQRETTEAKTNRDMDAINAVLTLTDSQKKQVLGVLSERAAEKVEQEEDARAFMSLSYGAMAADMDVSNFQGLASMLNADLADEPGSAYGSTEYFQWKAKQRAERIEIELSPLRYILNESQLARYRGHLEKESPR